MKILSKLVSTVVSSLVVFAIMSNPIAATPDTNTLTPGVLDPTFGVGGISNINPAEGSDSSYDSAIDATGNIIVAGNRGSGLTNSFLLIKYKPDGTLNQTFGNNGQVLTSFDGNASAYGVALQPKPQSTRSEYNIFVAGVTVPAGNLRTHFGLAKYDQDGRLDASFGNGGMVTTIINSLSNPDKPTQIYVMPKGGILVAGQTMRNGSYDTVIVRYNKDGSLDTTFGNQGIAIFPVSSSNDYVNGMVVQPDGKILLAGQAFFSHWDMFLLRVNTNGTLDSSFGNNGVVIAQAGTSGDHGMSVDLQGDKIILGGYSFVNSRYRFVLMKFKSGGDLDSTFGNNGKSILEFREQMSGILADIKVANDSTIVAAGRISANNGGVVDAAVVKLLPNGAVDKSFGQHGDGLVVTPIAQNQTGSNDDLPYSVLLQPDNKIVISGYTYLNSQLNIFLARYENGQIT